MADARLPAYRRLIADVYELAGASRATSEQIANEADQTAARWHVMSAVSEHALTVPAIARRLGLARQSVQRVANDLDEEGLATFAPNPAHQRSSLVSLTDRGRRVLDDLFERSETSRTALLDRAGLDVDELDGAREVLARLLTVFEA